MKVIKWIGIALVTFGFVLGLGTAGACDVDTICFDVAVIRAFIALAMVLAGVLIVYFAEKKEL